MNPRELASLASLDRSNIEIDEEPELGVAVSKVTLAGRCANFPKNRNELRYRELTKSVDQASLTKLFGSERVPWGLANKERKFVPSWEKEDHEIMKRIKAVECLR